MGAEASRTIYPARAIIAEIAYYLPDRVLTNEEISQGHPDWSVEKIFEKTGIAQRHIASESETVLDLAERACKNLFNSNTVDIGQIDQVLFCTQTPDYALPTTACMLQDRLGLPTTVAALDYNLGCSGYVYGLGLAKSSLESGFMRNVLLVTSETYSKWMDENDRSVKTIFGDGATATLLTSRPVEDGESIGPFVFGTDGRGAKKLIVHGSGARRLDDDDTEYMGEGRRPECLYMDGPEIFTFTIRTVPKTVKALLAKANAMIEDIDLFVFHQANTYMLEHLRKRCKIPEDRFLLDLENVGNTVSNTIPIALKNALDSQRLKPGMTIALVGFGVGYSWGACVIQWT